MSELRKSSAMSLLPSTYCLAAYLSDPTHRALQPFTLFPCSLFVFFPTLWQMWSSPCSPESLHFPGEEALSKRKTLKNVRGFVSSHAKMNICLGCVALVLWNRALLFHFVSTTLSHMSSIWNEPPANWSYSQLMLTRLHVRITADKDPFIQWIVVNTQFHGHAIAPR